jgi:hypothetical protein
MNKREDSGRVLARLTPSPARRAMTVGMPTVLALLLIWIAVISPPAPGWQVFLFAVAAGSLWLARQARRATARGLVLTPVGLREDGGRMLAPIAEIERVDRGALAFKPSGGFVLHLAAPGPAGWAPGLWWRVGRRLGVGGATNPMEGRAMADIIAVRIALRDTPRS